MDLKSGYRYRAVENGLMSAFPKPDADLSCDVTVVGAGITRALEADELAGHGHDVVVLDQLGAGLLAAQIERRPRLLTGLFSFARLG